MYQNLIVMGAVGRNAEIRYLPSGQQMAVFSLQSRRILSLGWILSLMIWMKCRFDLWRVNGI